MTQGVPQQRLGDLFTFKNGRAFKKEEWSASGLPIIRIQNLNSPVAAYNFFDGNYSNDILVKKGDLLFSWSGTIGSSFGPHVWDREPGLLNQHIFKVGHKSEIEKRYALHALRFITAEIEKNVSGAVGLVHITKERLNELLIPVPPIAEQRRIVVLLDEAFAGIATAKVNAEKCIRNARAVFEGYLENVFTSRGTGWIDRRLSTLCDEVTVGYVGPMKNEYVLDGVPFLRSQNIRPFGISLDNLVFVREDFHRSIAKSRLRPGDLAIVRTGYPGTAAVIPDDLPDANCSDLVIMRPGKEVDPHFLAAFFNSAFGKRMVMGKLVGAAQKHFNVGAAKDIVLQLPPMPEQARIVARIVELRVEAQRLQSLYTRKLAALDELKQSLLQRAFSGEL